MQPSPFITLRRVKQGFSGLSQVISFALLIVSLSAYSNQEKNMAASEQTKALEKVEVSPAFNYQSNEDANQLIDNLMITAKQEGKLAMLVLGASWCHDSVGLQRNFSQEQMQALLEQEYRTLFLDVGFLDDLRHITQRFGYPAYFGTPTVFVIEPHSETLLNGNTLSKWQSADSVELSEYITYFGDIAKAGFSDLASSDSMASSSALNAEPQSLSHTALAAFEEQQIERLFKAYSVLGPLLKADEEGTLEDTDAFYAQWRSVYQFRTQLQRDLILLKQQVTMQDTALDSEIELELPIYTAFDWE